MLPADPASADVALLLAPAGYGKTTVLSQWAGHGERPYVWVTVEEQDNDPVRLLQHVVDALIRVTPMGDDVLVALASRDASPRDVLVPRLVDWLARHPGGGVLVLDDLHVLHDEASLGVVAALASGLPPEWGLAVASRRRPGISLVPLRGRRKYVEFGRDDLAFDVREAAVLLASMGREPTPDGVERLVRRVEGWPVAVYLVALAARAGADVAAGLGEGVDTPLTEFVRTAVLDPLPDATVDFLLRTSVLDRLAGSLCDAVAGTTGSDALLAELEQRNLLVVPEGRGGEWYRYHRLLADVLRTELRRRDPEAEEQLHRRAAAWFADHGRLEDATAHALAGGDVPTAARLLNACFQALANTSRIKTVRRWVEAIGDAGVDAYPPYAVSAAWLWALENDSARAQRFLARAEQADFPDRPADGSASLESAAALLRCAMAPLGVDQMLRDARRVIELEPPGAPWHPLASMLLGVAELLCGNDDAAAKAFERAAYFGHERRPTAVLHAHAQLSLLAADRGDWSTAATAAAAAVDAMKRFNLTDYSHSMLAHAAAARVSAHHRNRAEAQAHVSSAMRLAVDGSRQVSFPWLGVLNAVALGKAMLDLDDPVAAQRMARYAREHLGRLPVSGVLPAEVQRLEETVTSRQGTSQAPPLLTLTESQQRVLNLLPTHLTITQIGQELGVSRNTVKTHVAAIYRKLGATTRDDAVRRGRELGLLGA
jgi:LuxR family maltose regulon positive regulatory protein